MPDLWAASVAFHGALLVGAIAFYPKYGDKTDIIDKSLKGTKEALDALLTYLGRALAAHIAPVVVGKDRDIKVTVLGEYFNDSISDFLTSEIEEMVMYRRLVLARNRWSACSRWLSRGLLTLIGVEALFTLATVVAKITTYSISVKLLLWSFAISAILFGVCLICLVGMNHHHDQISKYRQDIL